ncbi:NUDIX hydrolase [Streptomyces doebereineriae]|uniref:NUDIX hydrolase n=1 Tax=Streptomyces doebereineriae TaxID=3075528 RepID=A0ABU2V6L7_9ACTN|nr:NUDIX hydrolase [Streptomyces sp. DSM 41640]MDT0481207.1 NUDIX hydrolase [Streptomyces sp. DSM 41640]
MARPQNGPRRLRRKRAGSDRPRHVPALGSAADPKETARLLGHSGGYVETGKSPLQAANREVREELGITPTLGRLLAVDWAPSATAGDSELAPEAVDGIRPQVEELNSSHSWPRTKSWTGRSLGWPNASLRRSTPERRAPRSTKSMARRRAM